MILSLIQEVDGVVQILILIIIIRRKTMIRAVKYLRGSLTPWQPRTNLLSGAAIAHLVISGNLENWAEMVAMTEIQIAEMMCDE